LDGLFYFSGIFFHTIALLGIRQLKQGIDQLKRGIRQLAEKE
jgi:hypothetical protein